MNESLIRGLWIGWVPVVAAGFRLLGPARTVLVAVIGGVLFLPADHLNFGPASFPLKFDKWQATGLGLILGMLLFDRQALAKFRPHWLDLLMVAYTLIPLVGLVVAGPAASADVVEFVCMRGIGWSVPYAMGRIYFGDAAGTTRVARALVLGGLAYIPCCLYEELAGPSNYLAVLIYGVPFKEGMVHRLGGFRPEVFLSNGIAVASWMSLTAVTATWLWLGKAWNTRVCPAWVPPLALVATAVSCRGVYGFINLAVGLTVVLLTRLSRTRAFLVLLMAIPVVYMGLRASNTWDATVLIRGAVALGRENTVDARLFVENGISREVLSHSPVFGFGTNIYHTNSPFQPDSLWLQTFWMGGVAGLIVHLSAIFLVPSALGLMTPPRRPNARESASACWALACWCLLQLLEGLHNSNNFPATALVGGSLVGSFLVRTNRVPDPRTGRAAEPEPDPRRAGPFPLIATLILIALIEALGRLKGGSPPVSPPPTPEVETREHRP